MNPHHHRLAPQRALALLIALVRFASVSAAEPPSAQTPRPNILLIVSDDQGYADAACLGGKGLITPHLDRLAAEGVRLTEFYVTWPACTPSRGSILTGRYPQRNGLYDMIRNNEVDFGYQYDEAGYAVSPEMTLGLDVREVTIAQVLRGAGYATGVVGKWDSGRARRFLPLQRGFDFFYGFANTGIDYWTHQRYGIPSLFRGNERIEDKGYATDLFEREALAFLRASQGRPWFLYFAPNAPHAASSLTDRGVQAQDKYLRMYPELKGAERAMQPRSPISITPSAASSTKSAARATSPIPWSSSSPITAAPESRTMDLCAAEKASSSRAACASPPWRGGPRCSPPARFAAISSPPWRSSPRCSPPPAPNAPRRSARRLRHDRRARRPEPLAAPRNVLAAPQRSRRARRPVQVGR